METNVKGCPFDEIDTQRPSPAVSDVEQKAKELISDITMHAVKFSGDLPVANRPFKIA